MILHVHNTAKRQKHQFAGQRYFSCKFHGGHIFNHLFLFNSSDQIVVSLPANNENYWEFSTCSLLYFDFFLNHLNVNNINCMSETGSDVMTLSRDVCDPDTQCEQANGPGSFLRRVSPTQWSPSSLLFSGPPRRISEKQSVSHSKGLESNRK